MRPSLSCALLACVLLAGCMPEPPDKERPPEPKAAQEQVDGEKAAADEATVEDPVERARAAQDTLDEADQRDREAIDASGV